MKGYELIGKTAAELMDRIENEGEGEIAEVIVIVRVEFPPGEESPDGSSATLWRASDPVFSHQIGLIESVRNVMMSNRVSDDS